MFKPHKQWNPPVFNHGEGVRDIQETFLQAKTIFKFIKKNQISKINKLIFFSKNEDIIKKKKDDFGNAQIILKSIRKPFSHIDSHIFYKMSGYPVKEMLQEVKKKHLKFLMNKKCFIK